MSDAQPRPESAKFALEESLRGATDAQLLEDMRRAAKAVGGNTITMAQYGVAGKAHASTIQRRFGSWSKALALAGLEPSRSKIGITDDELFDNIRALWLSLGRQPRYMEVKAPASRFSAGTYENKFGSWSKALHEFVAWANSHSTDNLQRESAGGLDTEDAAASTSHVRRRTRREISDRQRFRVLMRDGFTCKSCGDSPLASLGCELHVDHIIPWSKGGETTDENLVTKCKRCNLGKGNAFNL